MKRHRYCKFTIEQEKVIVAGYKKGLSYLDLSRKYKMSQHCVFNIMKAYNVKVRPNRTYFFNEKAFDALDSEQALYWLGFSYADGTVNQRALRFGLARKDVSHLCKMREFMEGDMPVFEKCDICWLEFHHVYLAKRLRSLGIIQYRGKFYLLKNQIPRGLEHHFIRGYVDGDGCISVSEQVVFLGQQDILTWISKTLQQKCNASQTKIRKRSGIHEVSWGGIHQARRLVKYIYQDATVWLERKKEVADNWRK